MGKRNMKKTEFENTDGSVPHAIKEFLTNYLPFVRRLDDDTINSYRITINLYLDFLKETQGISLVTIRSFDFSQKNIVLFLQWLQEVRKNSAPTINHRLYDIRRFCRYLMKKKDVLSAIELLDIEDIEPAKDTRTPDFDWLTPEEVNLILDAVSDTRNSVRDRFFLSLLYESGCRIDEILSLNIGDLVPKSNGEVDVHFLGKGKKPRTIPLSSLLWNQAQLYLEQYHPERASDNLLFYVKRKGRIEKMSSDNAQRILTYCEKRVREQVPDLPHLHPHLFRRSRAMHLLDEGVPLLTIKDWLGHSQIETTRFYVQLTEKMRREALNAMQENDKLVFQGVTKFKYADNDDMLRRLCGLSRG